MKRITLLLAALLLYPLLLNAQSYEWKGKWVTVGEVLTYPNMWMGFYKDVEVDAVPSSLPARISVDSRYWLWINGQMVVREGGVKRGPNRRDTYYEEVEIAPYLRQGRNDIALMMWYFGRDGFNHNSSGKPAMLFDAQSPDLEIYSDTDWQSVHLTEYGDVSCPHLNQRLAESDIRYDARETHEGWRSGKASYRKVMALAFAGEAPWGELHRNPLPAWKDWGVRDYLSTEVHRGGECDTLVCALPYDAQIHPILKFDNATEGVTVKILTDSYTHFQYRNIPKNLPVHAEYVTRAGSQEFECLDWLSGNKVMYLVPAGSAMPDVSYRETGYNAEFAGSFSCSSEFWNNYWNKSARTLYVNMLDTYFDCPDRERSQWTGDAVNNSEQSFYVLSREADALGSKWLHEICAWQKPNGQIYAPVPSGNWTKELSGQSLSSIGYYGLWTYYMQSGDIRVLEDTYDAVEKYLRMWTFRPDGTVEYRCGEWEWGDWGSDIDHVALINALYYHALKGHQLAAAELGYSDEAVRLKTLMDKFRIGFDTRFWNGKAYRSENYKGKTDDRVQALAAVCGLAYKERYPAIFAVLSTEFHASPYMERYVLQALCEMGFSDYGLKRFEQRYGKAVSDKRYTTLPENWEYNKSGSFNHAWSGGGIIPIVSYVVGLKPMKPGYSRFCIDPHPSGLKNVDLTVQTAHGPVSIHYEVKGKQISMDFTVPEGCICETYLDGKAIWTSGKHHESGTLK